ncbi:MAG: efflux RND transporter periplasmic adaptor subunit [Deltaproteobacteria bacterium]|nr:efflux RND transporter periplasmic adaptor subunit [Deltaproteobacteria bacterium]
MKKTFFIPLLIISSSIFVVQLSGCSSGANAESRKKKQPPQHILVKKIQKTVFVPEFSTIGKTGPNMEVVLSMEMAGKLKNFDIEPGDFVKKNQVIARVRTLGLWSQRKQASSRVNEIKTSLEQVTRDYSKMKLLSKQGVITSREFELQELQLKTQKSQLDMAKANLGQIGENLSGTVLKAPFSGHVTAVAQSNGNFVGMGTPLGRLVDLSTIRIKVGVIESDLQAVSIGSKVKVTINATKRKKFIGVVKFISPSAEQLTGTFPVIIEVKNSGFEMNSKTSSNSGKWEIIEGMTASVTFSRNPLKGFFVPVDSVTRSGNKHFLRVLDNKKSVEKKEIRIILLHENNYLVEGSLEEGDIVLVTGYSRISEKTKIIPKFI